MLKTKVCDITIDNCIYNASGPRTGSSEALIKISESKSGVVLSKSCTLIKQDGNPLPRFINKINMGGNYCQGSMNSEGLPNFGIDYYISSELVKAITSNGKPYIISLSGLNLNDNMEMLSKVYASEGISAIELNLACPNIPGKPIIAYDFEQMDIVLKEITSHPKFDTIPLGIKLAPYFDISYFEKAITLICKYPIKFIVTTNTLGNALFIDIDNECESIASNQGRGGLGGGFIKHIALSNVRILYKLLSECGRTDIDIIGVGGVQSGKDVFELILCGAKAIQVGTCHWTEGASCFERISKELESIMIQKGYHCIEDFRGKLKPYKKTSSKVIKAEIINNNIENNMKSSSITINIIYLLIGVIIFLLSIIGVLTTKLMEYY